MSSKYLAAIVLLALTGSAIALWLYGGAAKVEPTANIAAKASSEARPAQTVADEQDIVASSDAAPHGESDGERDARLLGWTPRLERPDSGEGYQCIEVSGDLVCGNSRNRDWVQELDDVALQQLGLTDAYAAFLASDRLYETDPDRSYEFALRAVALSGKTEPLFGVQPAHDPTLSTQENEFRQLATIGVSRAVQALHRERDPLLAPSRYDAYLDGNPEDAERLQAEVERLKDWIDAERMRVLGEPLFAGAPR